MGQSTRIGCQGNYNLTQSTDIAPPEDDIKRREQVKNFLMYIEAI